MAEQISLREFAERRGFALNSVRGWHTRGSLPTYANPETGFYVVDWDEVKNWQPPGREYRKLDGNWVSLIEYARSVNVSPSTARTWVMNGDLPMARKFSHRRGRGTYLPKNMLGKRPFEANEEKIRHCRNCHWWLVTGTSESTTGQCIRPYTKELESIFPAALTCAKTHADFFCSGWQPDKDKE